eukprot:TRINITY_DN49460_c0_g1_i2.p1 TRINITY_DN49460_c0_g1~~TRINITY_DN49460_c0_g1_i2.p1  ORF type:complete len:215 (+),score=129.05 TRINITY_DN49460_c0_g1_i2:394-1038(+)
MEHLQRMLRLHKLVNPAEDIVGWYSTGSEINYVSTLIHNVIAKHCRLARGLHVTIDTALTNSRLSIKGYTCRNYAVDGKELVARFQQVALELSASEGGKIGVDALLNGTPDDEKLDAPATILSDMDALENSLTALLENIETVADYVERVRKGEVDGDTEIGRAIDSAIASVPRLDADKFSAAFDQNVRDVLMIVYLANTTRAQLALADKIQALL